MNTHNLKIERIGINKYELRCGDERQEIGADLSTEAGRKVFRDGAAMQWGADRAQEIERRIEALTTPADEHTAAPILIRLADVKREAIHWLWRGRIARGKVTMIAGDPGLGKSLLTMDIAARKSSGRPWPDTPNEPNLAGSIIILNCEDDLGDTVAPRLHRAGANLSKIVALQGVRRAGESRAFDLQTDLPILEAAAVKLPDLAAVIIDPLTAYLGQTDSYKNAEVRALLAPLADFAAKHGAAIICVSHLNKGSGPAIYRTMGSLAFVAAARTAWAVTRDRDDITGERRLMLPIKNNLARDDGGLAFSITGGVGEVCCVSWEEGTVSTTADESLDREAPEQTASTETDRAADWLRELLANGPILAKDVFEAADDCGHAKGTLKRAKIRSKVETYRLANPGPWYWGLEGTKAQAGAQAGAQVSLPSNQLRPCSPAPLPVNIDIFECPREQESRGAEVGKDEREGQ